ncbi:hypothetical protein [Streptobacillus moniliformis]|uniref:hypothetical protein n=1 Tax=Streptobacillus moniliformis TaxID=34105 RepID=UPI000A844A00|nr:hypothetical protein [Streptobacillus moniliformis]
MEKYYKEQREIVRKFVDEIIDKFNNEKIDLSNKDYLISLLSLELNKIQKLIKKV